MGRVRELGSPDDVFGLASTTRVGAPRGRFRASPRGHRRRLPRRGRVRRDPRRAPTPCSRRARRSTSTSRTSPRRTETRRSTSVRRRDAPRRAPRGRAGTVRPPGHGDQRVAGRDEPPGDPRIRPHGKISRRCRSIPKPRPTSSALAGLPPSRDPTSARLRRTNDETARGAVRPDSIRSPAVEDPPSRARRRPARAAPLRPAERDDHPALVYFHGGGWVVGSLETHDGVCRALAARAAVPSSSPSTTASRRSIASRPRSTTRGRRRRGSRTRGRSAATRLAVGGDSAGGNLAAVVRAARPGPGGSSRSPPAAGLPGDRHRSRHGRRTASSPTGYGLTREAMRWYWLQYLGTDRRRQPILTLRRFARPDLGGRRAGAGDHGRVRPPARRGRGVRRRACGDAGVPVTTSRYDGLVHGFFRMPAVMSRANDALDEAAAALREAFAR